MWGRFVFTPQEYTFPVEHAKKWCQNKKLSLIRHFWPPFWNAILTEKCPNFDHWGLFFRCHGNETTNQRLQNSLSWPGCLLIKWPTKRASSRFLHRKPTVPDYRIYPRIGRTFLTKNYDRSLGCG